MILVHTDITMDLVAHSKRGKHDLVAADIVNNKNSKTNESVYICMKIIQLCKNYKDLMPNFY